MRHDIFLAVLLSPLDLIKLVLFVPGCFLGCRRKHELEAKRLMLRKAPSMYWFSICRRSFDSKIVL